MNYPSGAQTLRDPPKSELRRIVHAERWFFCRIEGRRRIGKTSLSQLVKDGVSLMTENISRAKGMQQKTCKTTRRSSEQMNHRRENERAHMNEQMVEHGVDD